MSEFFSTHGYPKSVIKNALRCAKQISRGCTLNPVASVTNEVPIVSVLYHPHNLPVCWILWSNWHILQNSTTVGMTFCDRPLVAFKKDWNLHDILVHSNLFSHANSTPGSPAPLKGARHAPTCMLAPPLEVPMVTCLWRGLSHVRVTTWYIPSPVSLATSSMLVRLPGPSHFFSGASDWHQLQLQQTCIPTL